MTQELQLPYAVGVMVTGAKVAPLTVGPRVVGAFEGFAVGMSVNTSPYDSEAGRHEISTVESELRQGCKWC